MKKWGVKMFLAVFMAVALAGLPAGATGAVNVVSAVPVAAPVAVSGALLTDQAYDPVWNDAQNRVLIKPQFFADYFDAEVTTAGDVTTIAKNGHTIAFAESESIFIMDGIGGRNLDTTNIVSGGEAYIPLRVMCEALGASAEWEEDKAEVVIGVSGLPENVASYMKGVTVFDQSTIRLEGESVVYIDPYRIAGEPHDADIILVTHTHGDHFDPGSIEKLMKDSTVLLIAGEGGADSAGELGLADVMEVTPNEEYTIDNVNIKTVPAYNTNPERMNHRQEFNFVGYIVEINGATYYSAGDTDYIEAMDAIDADVAFLPIDGRFNMEESEAAKAANAIAPKIAVPYHYDNFSSEAKARDFISYLDEGITGVIMTFRMYAN